MGGNCRKGPAAVGMIGRSGLETLQIRAMYAGDGLGGSALQGAALCYVPVALQPDSPAS